MHQYSAQLTQFGWMFMAVAALFAFGVTPQFARRVYPNGPPLSRRLAAPFIFGALAAACFLGVAFEALILTTALGLVLTIADRAKRRPRREAT